jgi:hypothetical protein
LFKIPGMKVRDLKKKSESIEDRFKQRKKENKNKKKENLKTLRNGMKIRSFI